MGPGGFFRTNPDLADILGDTDSDFENGPRRCWRRLEIWEYGNLEILSLWDQARKTGFPADWDITGQRFQGLGLRKHSY